MELAKENLSKYQYILSLVIHNVTFIILITWLLEQLVIL